MAMTGGSGPKPPGEAARERGPRRAGAPQVPGVSARIKFTNNLVDASSIQGTDPLLSGASGRLWASPEGGGKLRLELQSEEGPAAATARCSSPATSFTVYDGTSETVYEGTLPEGRQGEGEEDEGAARPRPDRSEASPKPKRAPN